MKRFKKINILKEIRLLSLQHLILPVLTISLALILTVFFILLYIRILLMRIRLIQRGKII